MFFVRSVLQPWAFVSGDAHERGACFPTVCGKEQARAWIFLVGAVRQSDDWVFQVTTWYQYNLCIKCLTHQQDSNSSRTSVVRICWEYMLWVMCGIVQYLYVECVPFRRRHVYITPTSYLELLSSFISVLAIKRKQVLCIRAAAQHSVCNIHTRY